MLRVQHFGGKAKARFGSPVRQKLLLEHNKRQYLATIRCGARVLVSGIRGVSRTQNATASVKCRRNFLSSWP